MYTVIILDVSNVTKNNYVIILIKFENINYGTKNPLVSYFITFYETVRIQKCNQ